MEKKPQLIAKENKVQEIKEAMEKSQGVLLADYRGLHVSEDTELRAKLRESGIQYRVEKNTLIRKAANDLGITCLDEQLNGPTSIAFAEDPVALAKIMFDFSKEHKALEIKGGLLDNKFLSSAEVEGLSKLPAREVLLAQVLAGMQAPLAGFAGATSGILRKFVYALDAVRQQKESA